MSITSLTVGIRTCLPMGLDLAWEDSTCCIVTKLKLQITESKL